MEDVARPTAATEDEEKLVPPLANMLEDGEGMWDSWQTCAEEGLVDDSWGDWPRNMIKGGSSQVQRFARLWDHLLEGKADPATGGVSKGAAAIVDTFLATCPDCSATKITYRLRIAAALRSDALRADEEAIQFAKHETTTQDNLVEGIDEVNIYIAFNF